MNAQCFGVQGKMPATRTRLKFNSTRECSQDRRLHWLSHRERMEENAWSSICRTFKVGGSFSRGQPKKNME